MALSAFALTIALAIAAALLMAGAVSAWTAASLGKRLAGLLVAHVAAIVCLALLGVATPAVLAGVAIALAYCALGAGLLARLQEAYASTEATDADRAEDEAEREEPRA